ncbi:hypothetical protein [Puerhibacterium puerhi]|uniref:hypothetical protein n=1 Tax=Puerhibacterium puerhi TaxID=2692623 RepID=UPI00135C311D|nr:hypothetical protein [Puerhibacterium puerhi]
MTAVCGYLDRYEVELVADFQQFYGLRLEQMWAGHLEPREVLVRIHGLMTEPWSRFRAAHLRDNPPDVTGGDGVPSWLGWTPSTQYLVTVANLLITKWGGKKAKPSLLKTPADGRRVIRPKSIQELLKHLGR